MTCFSTLAPGNPQIGRNLLPLHEILFDSPDMRDGMKLSLEVGLTRVCIR
jgi:hypothetical protein